MLLLVLLLLLMLLGGGGSAGDAEVAADAWPIPLVTAEPAGEEPAIGAPGGITVTGELISSCLAQKET